MRTALTFTAFFLTLTAAFARRNEAGWASVGAPAAALADVKIELAFALKLDESKVKELERALLERSTPGSPLYGEWLSNDEVHALVAPPTSSIDAVMDHLRSFGVPPTSIATPTPNSDFIIATVDIATAEAILGGARYTSWRHDESGATCVRLAPGAHVRLPAAVEVAVAVVEPTHRFPPAATRAPPSAAAPAAGTTNTPASLRALYNVTGNGLATAATNPTGHAVTAFLGQFYEQSDLDRFWTEYGAKGTGVAAEPKVVLVGDATAGVGGGESMLDIEYINAAGAGIHSEFWGFTGNSPPVSAENEPFLKWLYTMGNTSDAAIPKVFSTSYAEDEDSTTWAYAERVSAEFMKAGARGISLLVASGDLGANCEAGLYYGTKRTKTKAPNYFAHYAPFWPGSNPYVTAVGGTTLDAGRETAVALSTGGFSNRFAMPAWQADAVGAYLKRAKVPGNLYNASGRASPDVAAQATGFVTINNGTLDPAVAGTSCSSPTFAGVVALLTDRRLAAGKPALGFLNPLIYSADFAAALNDITEGASKGCSTFTDGWPALHGWDAVTGHGTPDFGRMAAVTDAL